MEMSNSNSSFLPNSSVVRSPSQSPGLDASGILQVAAYCLVFVVSLVGNTIVIMIIARNIQGIRRVVMNTSLLHMAIADLIATLVGMPAMVARILLKGQWLVPGIFGLILCKLHVYLIEVSVAVAALSIFAVSLERLLAVVFPLKKILTIKRVGILSVVLWVIALGLYAPKLYVTTVLQVNKNIAYCYSPPASLALIDPWRQIEGAFFTALFVITLIFYVTIIIKTQVRKAPGTSTVSETRQRIRNQMNRRILRQGLIVIAVHYICWLPFLGVYLSCLFSISKPSICSSKNIFYTFVIFFLGYCNSAVNPLLYTVTNENFRKGFKAIFRCSVSEERSRVGPATSNPNDESFPNGESLIVDTPKSKRPQRYRKVEDDQVFVGRDESPEMIEELPTAVNGIEMEEKKTRRTPAVTMKKWRKRDEDITYTEH